MTDVADGHVIDIGAYGRHAALFVVLQGLIEDVSAIHPIGDRAQYITDLHDRCLSSASGLTFGAAPELESANAGLQETAMQTVRQIFQPMRFELNS